MYVNGLGRPLMNRKGLDWSMIMQFGEVARPERPVYDYFVEMLNQAAATIILFDTFMSVFYDCLMISSGI